MKKIAILNTTILTNEGKFTLRKITLDEAKKIVNENETISAVGHQSTADVLTELLGIHVPMNRIQFQQEGGQTALCFKLNGRPEEGKILSRKEIEAIGYEFKLLEMEDPNHVPSALWYLSYWAHAESHDIPPAFYVGEIMELPDVRLTIDGLRYFLERESNREDLQVALNLYSHFLKTGEKLSWKEFERRERRKEC